MAIKAGITFVEWVKRLTKGYIQHTGKQPDNLDKLKIKFEAAQKVKQQNVVTEFPKDKITPFYEPRPGEKGFKPKVEPIKKVLSDDEATAQINKLREDFDFNDRKQVLQLLDDIDAGKAFGAFDDVQKKELRDMISKMYTEKPDFASGGIARVGMFLGGPIVPIVKGGKWFLKALRDTRKLMIQNKAYSPEQLKHYLNQIDDQIKNIEAGGKIPDEVIQTIRSDPKFKSVLQNPANDPDLREIEEVLLEYGEKHASGGIAGQLHLNEGGRAGFPFGGQALKAIRQAWRSNKDWGVGGPPYNPGATTFDIKELTKRMFGKELSLSELRQLEKSPLMGKGGETFDQFNQKFKNIKASVLREKMMERKLEAKAMINAAERTMKDAIAEGGDLTMAKKITSQMTRESKEALKEVNEGLKEIDIYMGMLQKKGRRLHAEGGLAHVLGV